MSDPFHPAAPPVASGDASRALDRLSLGPRRAAWRQRLVEAERGFVEGCRGDSAFFVYFFAGLMCVMTGLVLGVSLLEWLLLTLALTTVFAAEMFHQMVKSVVGSLPAASESQIRKTLRLGTAAVFVTICGAAVVVVVLFGRRLHELVSG